MKKSAKLALIGLASMTSAQAIADVWFVPRVEYSFTQYSQSTQQNEGEVEGDSTSEPDETNTVDANLLMLGGGATFGISAFYVDFDIKTTQDAELHEYYNGIIQFDDGMKVKDNGGFTRDEMSITTGFGFEHFSLFGGVKITKTEFTHELYYDSEEFGYPAFWAEDVGQIPLVEMTTFESTGVFGGVAISFTFGESGALSFNAAYSQIVEATLEDDWYFESARYNHKGTGSGLSASAKLTYGWLYAKAEYAKYSYTDYENQSTPEEEGGIKIDGKIDEDFIRLGGGIAIYF